jgi:hypothetical protein
VETTGKSQNRLTQSIEELFVLAALYFSGARRQALLTHALVEMTTLLGREDRQLADRLDDARTLDLHYVPSRGLSGCRHASTPRR